MSNKYAVLRGGCWLNSLDLARADSRGGRLPDYRSDDLGFRVIKKSDQSYRVVRGGSWINEARYCRSACRLQLQPDSRIDSLGFRVINRKERKI